MTDKKIRILINLFLVYKKKRNGIWKKIYLIENNNWKKTGIKTKKDFKKIYEQNYYFFEIKRE